MEPLLFPHKIKRSQLIEQSSVFVQVVIQILWQMHQDLLREWLLVDQMESNFIKIKIESINSQLILIIPLFLMVIKLVHKQLFHKDLNP